MKTESDGHQSELEDLRLRAQVVLSKLAENPPDRPKFVEFSGTPKSGKSTCIDIVSHFLRRVRLNEHHQAYDRARFKILAPTEGASRRTPAFLRDDLVAFNTWSASYALTHILEAVHHSDQYHVAILDRGIFDALAWFQVLESRGDITQSDMQRVHDFLLIDHWRSQVDAVFLFTADPSTSMQRENEGKLIDAPGRAMNEEFISSLNEAYRTTRETYRDQFKVFADIDTSNAATTTPQSTAIQVAYSILDSFEFDT